MARVRGFALGRPDSPSLAIGSMAGGVEGFRRSHREAEAVRGVAIVSERFHSSTPTVIAATDPGLSVVARLGGDVAGTREWVATVLGDLAGDDENDARLRETLRVYLGCGSSYKVAAEELNLHFNSVKYRVARAVERRGREIGNALGETGSTSNSRCWPVTGTAPRFCSKKPDRPGWSIGFCRQTSGGCGDETAGRRGQVVGCAGRSGSPADDGVAGGDEHRDEHRERGQGEHGGDGQVGRDDRRHGELAFLRVAVCLG